MNRTWKNKKGCFFDYAEGLFLLSVMEHWVLLNAIIDCFESVTGMVLALDSNPPKLPADPAWRVSATTSFLILVRKAVYLIKKLIPSSPTSWRKTGS